MNSWMSMLGSMMKQMNDATGSQERGLAIRPRRNRINPAIRGLVQEVHLHPSQLICPLFVQEGANIRSEIKSMPDVCRFSLDHLKEELDSLQKVGVQAINLFCYIPQEEKDATGSKAIQPDNLLQRAIRHIKQHNPDMLVITDIALDPFTDHGHDGVLNEKGYVDNDKSVELLSFMALRAAEAGADIVSPSDMMDGRVKKIRKSLDDRGFINVGIMSYAAKYASSFYSPFRDALQSAPSFGDKKSYQLGCTNAREALRECLLDEQEGADLLLIKPALTNLDIIAKARMQTHLPIGAYQVSGEYSMLMAACERGWLDFDRALLETLLSIRRAGADFIVTYAAKRAATQMCLCSTV